MPGSRPGGDAEPAASHRLMSRALLRVGHEQHAGAVPQHLLGQLAQQGEGRAQRCEQHGQVVGCGNLDRAVAELRCAHRLGGEAGDLLQVEGRLMGGGQRGPARQDAGAAGDSRRSRRGPPPGRQARPARWPWRRRLAAGGRDAAAPRKLVGRDQHGGHHVVVAARADLDLLGAGLDWQGDCAGAAQGAARDVGDGHQPVPFRQALQQPFDLDGLARLADQDHQGARRDAGHVIMQQLRGLDHRRRNAAFAQEPQGGVGREQAGTHPAEQDLGRRVQLDHAAQAFAQLDPVTQVKVSQAAQGARLVADFTFEGVHGSAPASGVTQ